MKKFLIVLLLAMSVVAPNFAASWYFVGNATDGTSYYIDNSDVKKTQEVAIIWAKMVNTDGTSEINQVAVNRYERTMAIMSWIVYSSHGNIINSGKNDTYNWLPIPPGTIASDVIGYIW